MGSKRGYSFLKRNFRWSHSCFQVLAVKTQNNTAVTQLSQWHGAPRSMGKEKGLLKAQQNIYTYIKTQKKKQPRHKTS